MYKYLTEQGKSLQQKPYQAYQGELVPEMNKYQTAALGQTQEYSDVASPYYKTAGRETADVMKGFQPDQFSQGVKDYMSPYITNVADATMKNLMENQAQARNFALSKAVGSGAFGGDRGGIVASELARQQGLATAGAMAPIYQQGYTQAADLYGKSLAGRLGAAQQYGNIGGTLQQTGLAGAGALGQAGTVPYNIASAKDAANYQQFAQRQAYPFQSLGFLANIASGLGGGMGGTTTSTQPGPSWLSQLGGLGTLFSMIPSDERFKEGMEPVGKTFDGQTIYKYRYKGDDKTQIGLSAQEVEKRHPDAVGKDNQGMRHVDYDTATKSAAHRGHFMDGGSSQGGLVPANMERQPYAAAGFVPYAEDPLLTLMEGRSKLGLSSYIPVGDIKRMESNMPKPVALEDTSFDTKGLSPYAAKGIGGLYDKAKDLLGFSGGLDRSNYETDLTDYSSDPSYGSYGSRGSYYRAEGGLVPRSHHAEGDEAKGDVPVQPTEPEKPTMSFSNLFNFSGPSFAEKMFNKGQPFSDEARSGILAAGLGMLASRSPFPLVAVGEGGLSGLNTYYNALKNKMETAKAGSEMNLQSAQAELDRAAALAKPREVDISALTAGTNAYEHVKQLYTVKQDEDGVIHVFGLGGQPLPVDQYRADMAEAARLLGLPVSKLIARHIQESNSAEGRALGGRAHHALGGFEEGDKTGLAAGTIQPTQSDVAIVPAPALPPMDQNDVVGLAKSVLKPSDIGVAKEPPVKIAQAAPVTQSDATPTATPAPPAETVHPTLQRIMRLNDESKKLYQEADEINAKLKKALLLDDNQRATLKDLAANKRTQALQYETQANELMKLEQTSPSGIKFRWEYGAEEPENAPPKPITPENKRGEIDPNTGRMITAPVDLGYPQTGGLPTTKLGKHQVRIGEDPMSAEATKSSQELLKDFQDRTSAVQDGILNTVKFAAALKVLQSGALTGDATALSAIAKDLGFDSIANELALGKNIEASEIALKTQVDNAIAKSTASFARPTQIEFGKIEEGATPSRNSQPGAAHSVAQTALAGLLSQQALMRDWGNAQANGARNFSAYQNYWRQLNDRSKFEDAAGRLLGNFKGQSLPSDDQLVEGGVYVVPNVEKGKPLDPVTERAYKMGLTGGDVYTVKDVKHYKDDNGVEKVKVGQVVKLAPNEIYGAMLQQPGFAYGVR